MNLKPTIIVIEDEKSICNFIETTLTAHNYKVITASTGQEGLSCITSCFPDLVLLDLGLPDIDGIEVVKQVRSWSMIPIIVISARTQEQEKVLALDTGCDDYITKPFGTSELLARIRTALRHQQHLAGNGMINAEPIYSYDDLTIDFSKRLVTLAGQEIHLTQIEYKLVSLLAKNGGRVLTYDYIINHIWGPYADNNNNQILRVNMAHIRRKLEKNPAEPNYIFTEIGVGYRMRESQQ
ncbi:MAG: response regulator [Lachnospiraceae bacterium]|nr:response regulator [Lachnospiraceae bacterium]MDO5549644.1 response regulator [Lachnospiraceae bacterium]